MKCIPKEMRDRYPINVVSGAPPGSRVLARASACGSFVIALCVFTYLTLHPTVALNGISSSLIQKTKERVVLEVLHRTKTTKPAAE